MDAILSQDELAAITGHARRSDQRAWLANHGWLHHLNAKGELVVGRWYADHRLAGLNPGRASTTVNLESVR